MHIKLETIPKLLNKIQNGKVKGKKILCVCSQKEAYIVEHILEDLNVKCLYPLPESCERFWIVLPNTCRDEIECDLSELERLEEEIRAEVGNGVE